MGILLDTQGPEIRTGDIANDLHLKAGDVVSIVVRGTDNVEESSIQINYEDLIKDTNIGDTITVDNGLINLQVEKQDRLMKLRSLTVAYLRVNDTLISLESG